MMADFYSYDVTEGHYDVYDAPGLVPFELTHAKWFWNVA